MFGFLALTLIDMWMIVQSKQAALDRSLRCKLLFTAITLAIDLERFDHYHPLISM